MRTKIFSVGWGALAVLSLILFATGIAAGEERVIHKFGPNGYGALPYGRLIWDAAGNLYGVAACTNDEDGVCSGYGIVFELTPSEGGSWSEKVLYVFNNQGGDTPRAGLIWDAAGNLYGTTDVGGSHHRGTVFELTPAVGGRWTEKVLHSFDGADGQLPLASLIWDAAGNLYGTTGYGGTHGDGTVFELTPSGDGQWSEKVLHNFGSGLDGRWPILASLIWDAAGNLYGTTYTGGSYGFGTVFELTLAMGGDWTEKVLHNFGHGMDGQTPQASLVWDAAGNLYGTSQYGGTHGEGTVFEMTPKQGGGWTEKVLHNFGSGLDGGWPMASLIWDAAGNLYGTTYTGGVYGQGTVFQMMPRQGGGWTEHTLHHFNYSNGRDGAFPSGDLIWGGAGNLYGVTSGDSAHGAGTVFEIMACVPLPSNMIAWYSFDQTGSVQTDLAKGNTATAHGTSSIAGRVSNALLFDGTTSYAEAAQQSWLDIGTNNLSMVAWVKIARPADDLIFDKRDAPEQGYAFFLWPDGRVAVQLGSHGRYTNYVSNTAVPADNHWHLVAITVVRNSHTGGVWYLDGAPIDRPFDPTTYQSNLLNSSAPLEIGVRESGGLGGGGYFRGGLDELQIFNRALTPAEIQSIYLAGSAGTCKQ